MRKIFFIILLLVVSNTVFAQTQESKGRDFCITFLPNYHNYWNDPVLKLGDSVYLFIYAEQQTNAEITFHSVAGVPFTENFTINANEIYVFKKTSYDFALRGYNLSGQLGIRNNSERVSNISFRLTTDNPVLVYGHSQAVTTSESFNVIPVMDLGKEYLIMTYNSSGMQDGGPLSGGSTPSQFAVVAIEDSTNITITPKSPTQYNNLNIQNIQLQKGEVYLVQSKITEVDLNSDLTGSEVKSDKPVAVFSGHQRAAVPYDLQGVQISRDMLIEQLPSIDLWSREALVTPFPQPSYLQNTWTNDLVRIMAAYDSTEIYIDGNLKDTLNRGEFLQLDLPQFPAFKVTASSPILVCSYKRSSQTQQSNSLGDPLMQIIPSIDLYGNVYKFMAIQTYEYDQNGSGYAPVYTEHYITVIAPETSFKQVNLDGNILDSALFNKILGTNYYYAFKQISEGIHEISAVDRFGLFICGYGFANSYGYFGGMNFKRLNITPNISTNSPICEDDDLMLFADTIPNAKYNWSGPNGFTSTQQNPILKKVKSNQSGKYFLYVTVGNINSITASIDISISTFLVAPGDSSLMFVGNAKKQDKYIKLNEARPWDGGSIWLKNRFSVKQNFTTTFQFRTRFCNQNGEVDGSLPGADGLAFVMQNHSFPVLGYKGGSMGYTGITNSLAIEFDLFHNYWDPNGNHIAVQSLGSKPNIADHTKDGSCLGINDKIVTIRQDSLYYSKIEYDWDNKTLKIYLDSIDKLDTPALTIPNIDLASYLQLEEGEYVYIGFTTGTGESFEEHDLFNWTIPCKNQLVDVDDKYTKSNDNNELSISPNPANNNAVISYNINKESNVSLMIINVYGQEISKPISNEYHNTGNFRYYLETASLAEGVYLVILQMGNSRYFSKFIVVK